MILLPEPQAQVSGRSDDTIPEVIRAGCQAGTQVTPGCIPEVTACKFELNKAANTLIVARTQTSRCSNPD